MFLRSFALLLLTVLPFRSPHAQQPPPLTEVAVRNILLFSSGVGYYEHAGTVRGNGSAELRFKSDQINDILKSLVLQDQDGGRINAVSYASQDPLAKVLKGFQVDLTGNPGMAQLLNQLRGARVIVTTQGEQVNGTIVGVETHRPPADKSDLPGTSTLNLLNNASIRSIDLRQISVLTLDDARLQDEFTRALAALGQARDQDRKPVTVSFSGSGDRRVRMGYVVESPVWKTSYRLLLSDTTAWLQGWAIVENQTESDWNGVSLSLVSGRPVSFSMDLYQPLYLSRPVVVRELGPGVRPRLYESGMSTERERVSMSGPPAGQQPGNGWITGIVRDAATGTPLGSVIVQVAGTSLGASTSPDGSYTIPNVPAGRYALQVRRVGYVPATVTDVQAAAASQTNADLAMIVQTLTLSGVVTTGIADPSHGARAPFTVRYVEENPVTSVRSVASGSPLGALFQYSISNVTLARQRSAMLPIVTDSIQVERLSIYNAAVLRGHPLNGIRLRNSTGNHLLEGPVTVLDANAYAGDARIDNTPPRQERLLSYGVDLDVFVDATSERGTVSIVTARINKGLLSITRRHVARQEYQIDNRGDKSKAIVVEHPLRQGWRLVETQAPVETTPSHYRFQGPVAPGKITTLRVSEELVNSERIALVDAEIDNLIFYQKTGEIPAAVREGIATAIRLRQEVLNTRTAIGAHGQRVKEISDEQVRIRENMKTVGQTSQYYTRLLTKLNDQESELERLQTERVALQQRVRTQEAELQTYLDGLSIG